MVILLRVMIILMLIMSGVALYLGIDLFGKREELKGRTLLLENSVVSLAKNIETEVADDLTKKNLPIFQIQPDQLRSYYVMDPTTKQKLSTGAGTLDDTLKGIVGKAQVQYGRLNDTRDSLKLTEDKLVEMTRVKERLDNELTAEKQVTKEQAETIAKQKTDIDEKTTTIGQLETDKKTLQEQTDEQKTQLAKLLDEKTELTEANKRLDQQNRQLLKRIAYITEGNVTVAEGDKGQILLVNTNWNFVVVATPKETDLVPGVELGVRRSQQFVGKVRVSDVKLEHGLAIADILDEWQQSEFKETDHVFF